MIISLTAAIFIGITLSVSIFINIFVVQKMYTEYREARKQAEKLVNVLGNDFKWLLNSSISEVMGFLKWSILKTNTAYANYYKDDIKGMKMCLDEFIREVEYMRGKYEDSNRHN